MSVFHFPSESAALLLSIIKNYAPSCSVYVFGYRTSTLCSSGLFATATSAAVAVAHFDLVVFTTKVVVNGALNISTAISEQSKNTITASVLLHKVSDLATTQPGQQWFFNKVLYRGERLCIDVSSPPFLLTNCVPERNYENALVFWHKCEAVAGFNLQAAGESALLDVQLCKIALLHTAVVQIALGLLRVFMGYTPRDYSLRYLLALCSHFSDLPHQLFEKESVDGVRRFKMLCASPTLLQHRVRLDASDLDFEVLLGCCERFLQLAEEEVGLVLGV